MVGGTLVAGFLAAPAILARANGSISDSDLSRMSDAGQAYGGLSALLSGAGTGAVAVALLLQVRQIRTCQAQGVRMIQIQLMSMLVERPELRPVSPTLNDVTPEQRCRDIYTNRILRYLEMGYEVGYFPAASVHAELRSQFAIEDIRRFWERTRALQLAGIMNSAQREFAELVDDAYRHTGPIAKPPPVERSMPTVGTKMPAAADGRRTRQLMYVATAVVAAAVLGRQKPFRRRA